MQFAKAVLDAYPKIDLPYIAEVQVFKPQTMVLRFENGSHFHMWTWCYLSRDTSNRHASNWNIDVASLSLVRCDALLNVVRKINALVRVTGRRAAGIKSTLGDAGVAIKWFDRLEHSGIYESIFTDRALAIKGVEEYASYVKQGVRSGRIATNTASSYHKAIVWLFRAIYGPSFEDEVGVRVVSSSAAVVPTVVPLDRQMTTFNEIVTAAFDNAADTLGRPEAMSLEGRETWMDLACLSFAAIAIMDSGANLGPMAQFELDESLKEQVESPDIRTLNRREVKFRAAGREVPLSFTTTTVRRFRKYLEIRRQLIDSTRTEDPGSVFVMHERQNGQVSPINKKLLSYLGRRLALVSDEPLPKLNLRQLRSFKQNFLMSTVGPQIASELMGHTVETAIRVYSQGRLGERAKEMGGFLGSLQSTVTEAARAPGETEVGAGGCREVDAPVAALPDPPVEPDCKKNEGCLFCDKFILHADERDIRKILSFRYILRKLYQLQPAAMAADSTYGPLESRVASLIVQLREKAPEMVSRIEIEVDEQRLLSPYWKAKAQQLAFLGLIS